MRKLAKAVVALVGLVALLVGVGWLGLQVKPKPFSPHPERTPELDTSELPSDLPTPVSRYIRLTMGEKVPRIDTAVVWARGEFNFNGLVWFPMRLKSYHVAGREFRRDMELTWFGMPVFRGTDSYIDGKGTLKFTGLLGLLNVSDEGEKIDQGDNLVMWAGSSLGRSPWPTTGISRDNHRSRGEWLEDHMWDQDMPPYLYARR